MKLSRISVLVAFLAVVFAAGSVLAADSDRAKGKSGGKDGQKRAKRGGHGGGKRGKHRKMPDIGLTADQKTAIAGLRKAAHASAKEAKTPEARKAIFAKMKTDIHALFTKEQQAKLKEARKNRPGGGEGGKDRPDLGLTEEQKKKMKAIHEGTMAKMKAAKTPEERKAIHEAARAKVKALLGDEKFEKFQAAHKGRRHRGMPDIGLSDTQKTQVEGIRKKAKADMKAAKGKDSKKAIHEKMRKDINALLTDDQRAKMKKFREGHRHGDRKGGKGAEGEKKGGKGEGGERKGRKGGGGRRGGGKSRSGK
jgi:Spy/CpxP family protein refolding chaperone